MMAWVAMGVSGVAIIVSVVNLTALRARLSAARADCAVQAALLRECEAFIEKDKYACVRRSTDPNKPTCECPACIQDRLLVKLRAALGTGA